MALLALFAASIAWLAGFAAFERYARIPVVPPPVSDGIVALTGGADRIETALRLLAEGRAPRLLVSGVGGGGGLAEVTHGLPLDPALLAHLTIGRIATDTVGNADETAAWARQNGVRTLIVVTAGYHMPRALREIGRALPGVELRPVPVRPPALRGGDRIAALRLLAVEYDKFIGALLGANRLFSRGGRL